MKNSKASYYIGVVAPSESTRCIQEICSQYRNQVRRIDAGAVLHLVMSTIIEKLEKLGM